MWRVTVIWVEAVERKKNTLGRKKDDNELRERAKKNPGMIREQRCSKT